MDIERHESLYLPAGVGAGIPIGYSHEKYIIAKRF